MDSLPGIPFGFNLIHSPGEPALEARFDRYLDDTLRKLPHTLSPEGEALLAASDPNYPFPDFSEDTRATTFYTTGTTGLPKGVELVHDCWVKQAAAVDASPEYAEARAFLGQARVVLGKNGLVDMQAAVALNPRLRSTAFLVMPHSLSRSKFCMLRAPICSTSA